MNKFYFSLASHLLRFKNSQRGVTAIEYGLLALGLATAVILIFYENPGVALVIRAKFVQLSDTVIAAILSN